MDVISVERSFDNRVENRDLGDQRIATQNCIDEMQCHRRMSGLPSTALQATSTVGSMPIIPCPKDFQCRAIASQYLGRIWTDHQTWSTDVAELQRYAASPSNFPVVAHVFEAD